MFGWKYSWNYCWVKNNSFESVVCNKMTKKTCSNFVVVNYIIVDWIFNIKKLWH
jgi:hypothetical protein